MFYCDNCAKNKGWPELGVRSHGVCELCNKMAACNDWPIKLLMMQSKSNEELKEILYRAFIDTKQQREKEKQGEN